jgi:hypothetical protein
VGELLGVPGSLQRAERVLQRMERLYKAGDEGAATVFNAVLPLTLTPESGEEAQHQRLKRASPADDLLVRIASDAHGGRQNCHHESLLTRYQRIC